MTAAQTPQILPRENEAHIQEQPDGRYRVNWMGFWFGGDFRHVADALLLRDWCLEQSAVNALGWINMANGGPIGLPPVATVPSMIP